MTAGQVPAMGGGGTPCAGLRAVAFDVDATLVDFLRFKRIAAESAALAMVDAGLDMEPALATEKLWSCYQDAGLDGDAGFERFLRSATGSVPPHLLAAGIHAYLRTKEATLEPYPGVLPTLIALVRRGLTLCVVTDAERGKALHRLRAMRIAPFFEHVVTLDDSLFGKADEQPFRQLLGMLGCSGRQVLMVGDHLERDVRSARRAGLWTAFASYGAQGRHVDALPEKPDFVLRRVDEVVGVVDELRALPARVGRPIPA